MNRRLCKGLIIILLVSACILMTACPGGVVRRADERKVFFELRVGYSRIALSSDGDIYLLGVAQGVCDLDPGRPYEPYISEAENGDILLSKYSPDGIYEWSRTWDASGGNYALTLALDPSGNIVIGGIFQQAFDLDPGPGIQLCELSTGRDAFVVKLDPDGNFISALDWPADLGDVTIDSSGCIYAIGRLGPGSNDLDPGPGTDIHNLTTNAAYLLKLNPDGSYSWGAAWEQVYATGLTVGPDDSVCVGGSFSGTVDLDPGPGTSTHTCAHDVSDIFIVKLDSNGDFVAAETWGDERNMLSVENIAIDTTGKAYAAGTGVYTTGMIGCIVESEMTTYLACFDSSMSVEYVHTWEDTTEVAGLEVDPRDNIWLHGHFNGSIDFDPGEGSEIRALGGEWGGRFLCRLDSDGDFVEVRTWPHDMRFQDITSDSSGNIYMTGGSGSGSGNFLLRLGDPSMSGTGHADGASLDIDPPSEWTVSFGECFNVVETQGLRAGTPRYIGSQDWVNDLELDSDGNIYITGVVHGDCDFDPGEDVDQGKTGLEEWFSRAFISKFLPDGTFEWVKTWDRGVGYSVALDSDGSIHVLGSFETIRNFDLDPGAGVEERRVYGGPDGFIVKLTRDGEYIWGRTFGDEGVQGADSVVVDLLGNVYIAGNSSYRSTTSETITLDFNPCPTRIPGVGAIDFLVKLSPDGDFLWTRNWPGVMYTSDWNRHYGLVVDPNGNTYFAASNGLSDPIDFDPGPGVVEYSSDAYLLSLDPDGEFRWVWPYDGQYFPTVQQLALGPNDTIYLLGSRRFPSSSYGSFLAMFDFDGKPLWSHDWSEDYSLDQDRGDALDIAIQPSGVVCFAGYLSYWYRPSGFSSQEEPPIATKDVLIGSVDPDDESVIIDLWGRGTYMDAGTAIEFDALGNCYVAGVADGIFLSKLLPEINAFRH